MGCIGGYVNGFNGKTLGQVLRDAPKVSIRPQTEAIDGHTCSVVDAVMDEGKISAWFAADAAGGLAKLTIARDANCIFNGKPLTDLKISDKDKDRLVGADLTMHSVQFRQISGHYVPTRATVIEKTTFKDG